MHGTIGERGFGGRAPWRARLAVPLRRLFDSLLPARCLECGCVVLGDTALCPSCWPHYDFLADPQCRCCGFPFAWDPGAADSLCAACIARPPAYDRARAVLAYDAAIRPLILDFKHGDRTAAAPVFGRWLARAAGELLGDADLVAPVPLHRDRLFSRRYNQSALLALAVGAVAGLPVLADLVERRRRTPSQGHLSPDARRRNVRGAFAVRPEHRDALAGRRVLLVDDVFTTGATVEECARVLRRAGAAGIDVVTLARVVRPRGG